MSIAKDMVQLAVNSYNGEYGPVVELLKNKITINISNVNAVIGDYSPDKGSTWVPAVVFQGSEGFLDWKDNLTFWKYNIGDGIKIHKGFYRQIRAIYPYVKEEMESRLTNQTYILSVGHSLGADLAILFSYLFSKSHPNLFIDTYPIAAARLGNYNFKKDYDSKPNIKTHRYVYKFDIVSKVPWPFMNYFHVNGKIKIGEYTKLEKILYPILKLTGRCKDHYPMKYLKAIED